MEEDKKWSFTPLAKVGDKVTGADWLGNVKENWLDHKIMVPFKLKGEYTIASIAAAGEYTIKDTIAVLKDEAGKEIPVTMIQKWPVKVAIRNYVDKPRPSRQMETGVRVIDTMNPILEGGTGFIPGPFGTGKTVLQHALSRFADADIIIMAACGEQWRTRWWRSLPSSRNWKTLVPVVNCTREPRLLLIRPICPWLPVRRPCTRL